MCVVSNVFDQGQRWFNPVPSWPGTSPKPDLTREQIEDFIRRLQEAKAQDEAEGNPDCGSAEKKEKLLESISYLEVIFSDLKAELENLKEIVESL